MRNNDHTFIPKYGVSIILGPYYTISVYCEKHEEEYQVTPHNYFKSKYGLPCCSKENLSENIKKSLKKVYSELDNVNKE